jgi:hypothetical protein
MSVQWQRVRVAGLCVAALMAAGPVVWAEDQQQPDQQQLMDRIKQLEQRISELESRNKQEVSVPPAEIPQKTLDFLGQVEMSGYVSASYIDDFSKPSAGTIAGRLYDSNNNQFTPDKFKLTLEKPVDFNPTNWHAGFRADLIAGKDAEVIHSRGLFGGQSFDLEQAYVKFNVPVGNGLTVLFGKHVTMLGVEVVEEVSNPNWSIGNQFMYVENTTQTGVQLAYKWNDKIDTEFCVINGWDQVTDVNISRSFMGRLGWTIDDKGNLGIVGYGGPEEAGDNHDWRTGVDVVFNRKLSDKLSMWLQGDYGHEDNAPLLDGSGTTAAHADWYAAGLWLTYDFTDKVELALRGDYLKDKHGVRTPSNSGAPLLVGAPGTFTVAPKELYSATATFNIKPMANLQIRPEVRYDRSAADTAFNGKQDQITAGIGVAYLY